jgi:hypothetical protein
VQPDGSREIIKVVRTGDANLRARERPATSSSTSLEDMKSKVSGKEEHEPMPPSILSYGNSSSPAKKIRIDDWLNQVSDHPEDASAGRDLDYQLYEDWLDWSESIAKSWLQKLDQLERRYRIAGLQYHQVSHTRRHSSKPVHGIKLQQHLLDRLSHILETDHVRTQQPFFIPWIEINNTAVGIIQDVKYYKPLVDDIDFLKVVYRKFELSLLKITIAVTELMKGLEWLEESVGEVTERSGTYGNENLVAKHSREGGIFRRWLRTFPEVETGMIGSRTAWVEWYINRILEMGIEKDQYWSARVNMTGQTSSSTEA